MSTPKKPFIAGSCTSNIGSIATTRIAKNPKYDKVKAVVDSGETIRKHMKSEEDFHNEIKFKREEAFRRIQLSTFITLVIESTKESLDSKLPENSHQDTAYNDNMATISAEESKSECSSVQSSFSKLIQGIGELDIKEEAELLSLYGSAQEKSYTSPYLLLDARAKEEFQKCRIISAKHYSYSMACRAFNYETKDLFMYKNKPGHIIVIYDEDETIAPRVVTILAERGYDNVFLLSGGLRLASRKFPKGLIVQNVPEAKKPFNKQSPGTADSLANVSKRIKHQISKPVSTDEGFSAEDINMLQIYLDSYFKPASESKSAVSDKEEPNATKSSDLGTAVSDIRRRNTAGNTGKLKPWKF